MKVLVVGGGGREHALCWKLRQSPHLEELYCAPGNPGIGEIADLVPISTEEVQQLADFAAELGVDLTVVGPELPLSLGLADELAKRDLPVFGPRREAALLESSKVFAKEFMVRHEIPTAPFVVAHDEAEVQEAVGRMGLPLVLKADGLAAGKGVLIVTSPKELEAALAVFFRERRFGTSGDRVLVEPCLVGEEVSFMGLADGAQILPLATSKDYKRIGEDDSGPNTGGMGAHSPSGCVSGDQAAHIVETVLRPAIAGMREESCPFVGVLYAGLMMTAEGPQVLEFNVRFGDPEAQALLLRIEDDLLEVLHDAARGKLEASGHKRLHFRKEASSCLVLASRGYPDKPTRGEVINGLDAARGQEGVEVFHAGTARKDGRTVSAGGRVLNVCATGHDLREALRRAYAAAAEIHWPSKVLRSDIGKSVLQRSKLQ